MAPNRKDLPDWTPDPRSPLLVGNRYQLLDEIGRGAASVVYKARDVEENRLVALKVLRASAALHPRLLGAFEREAAVGERIHHPNVVRIFAADVHDGWTYLAMEHVAGRTLADALSMNRRLTLDQCESLFRQLLAALDCIHRQGIVHRDVKPAHVRMAHDGVWKLMDFGISRELGAEAAGAAAGTPDYMSPEQLMGKAATPASDIYAAGVVFYEALCGETPFRGWQPVRRCTELPPPLQSRRTDLPEWLNAMVLRALEPRPEARYADAASMVEALGPFAPDWRIAAAARAAARAEAEAAEKHTTAAPVAALLRDEPGDLKRVLGVGVEALCALIAISGVDHAPLTPQTLRIDGAGLVEISPAGPSGAATEAGATYAAPETLGGAAPPSPTAQMQADQYALGMILYELLLGRDRCAREFPGPHGVDGRDGRERRRDAPRRPRPAAQVVEGVPAAASALLDRLLDPAPERRFASYEAALDAVGEVLGDVNRTPARPRGTATASSRSCRGLAMVSVGVAALALALAALATRLIH